MRPTEEKIQKDPSDLPIYLFKQGNNCEAYRYFGAHLETRAGESGVVFRVWAPHAAAISVVGDFNSWKPGSHPMRKVDGDSVWELFIPGVKEYDVYKYCVTTRGGDLLYKADPYAFHAETRPSNGSKVYDITGFAWHDDAWQAAQKKADVINGPMNIYEMHAGSWKPVSYTHRDVYKRQGQVGGIDLEDSHVAGVILAHHGGGAIGIADGHGDVGRAGYNVRTGQDIAVGADHNTAALSLIHIFISLWAWACWAASTPWS